MGPEPKPPPCTWCHWPVRLLPAPPAPPAPPAQATAESSTGADQPDEPARVRQCTNPWCPTRRAGFGIAP